MQRRPKVKTVCRNQFLEQVEAYSKTHLSEEEHSLLQHPELADFFKKKIYA